MTCKSTIKQSLRTEPAAVNAGRSRKVTQFRKATFLGSLLILLVGLVPECVAQEDVLSVFGTVKAENDNRKLAGVRVVVYQDGTEFDAIVTDAKGGYEFDLPLRHAYVFSFQYDGHSNKRIEVDASGIPLDVRGARNMDLDMSMMPLPPGFDAKIFEDLYGKGQYNANENTVIFDNNYTVRMRNKVQAELARLERMAGQEAATRAQFDEFVQKGNRAKDNREWQKAVDFYDSALGLFPDESDVIAKRAAAQKELDAANAANADEAAFQSILANAEDALKRDRLDEARKAFEQAEDLRPSAPEPKDGLRRVAAREVAMANSAATDEAYNELIEDGDIYFDRQQWDRALDKFAEASALKPNESYPKNRMEEARTRQADLASQQADLIAKTIEYEGLMDEANLLFREDRYAEALVKYEAAGAVLPAERYWQQRAEACRERMAEADAKDSGRRGRETEDAAREAELAAERERRKSYDAANDAADELFRSEDYNAAIRKYEEASTLFPAERYPKQRIAEAEKRMDLASREVNQRDEVADDGFGIQGNTAADEALERARAESDAADEAAAAQRKAREAAEASARSEAEHVEAEYTAAVADADAAFDRQDWRKARQGYEEALSIKPSDRYAKGRLDRITREEERNATASVGSRPTGPSQADLDRERADQERQAAEEADRIAQQADELKAQQQADEADRRSKAEELRREKEELERKRAQQIAAQMNANERDEVEDYYQEALASEAQARKLEVEAKKAAQAALLSDAAQRAADRAEDRERENAELLRQSAAISEAGARVQSDRQRELEDRADDFARNERAARRQGADRIERGQSEVNLEVQRQNRLVARHAEDYALNVPKVEEKKRVLRDLFTGMNRASADRRSEAIAQLESTTRSFRALGDGANQRAQERWLAARRKERQVAQQMQLREQEARQRAYNEQVAAASNLREVGPRDPEDYKISEADSDILQGVHEQSYDIPNGLVIERTVRTGNHVIRYRKVVTKTGVYYFREDRSITADTWRRETTVVTD